MSKVPSPLPVVRRATTDDYAAVSALANSVQELHAAAMPHIFRSGSPALPYDYFAFVVTSMAGAVYVATVAGVIVGYLVIALERSPAFEGMKRRRIASVEQIGVAAAARRQGIGRALMDAAIQWATTQEAEELRLVVWEFNQEAIAFYERLSLTTQNRTMAISLDP